MVRSPRPWEAPAMKIREIRSIPLMGRTPQGGWDHDVDPEENLHTLGQVLTDDDVSGIGSVYRRQSFMPWIERRVVDIIQPDCTKVGGLSESRRIGWMAYAHNVTFVPHGWNTAVGLAADLHLVAALPPARYVEYLTPSPYIEEIVATPFALDDDGLLAIPTGPGLGLDLDWDGINRFSRGVD